MKRMIFCIDVEPDIHTGKYRSVAHGIPIIEKLLKKYKIKATFFVTCDCIKKYPKIFKNLIKKRHEIALHGYRHVRFDELTRQQKEVHIKKAKACFKKYIGFEPKGFRAPQHSIDKDTLDILEKEGFKYDSSYAPLNLLQFFFFPKKVKTWIEQFFSKRNLHKIRKSLIEIPTASFLFPFTSLAVRLLPIPILILFFEFMRITNKQVVFYVHSWDFIELSKSRVYYICDVYRFTAKLNKLLMYISKRTKFITFANVIKT